MILGGTAGAQNTSNTMASDDTDLLTERLNQWYPEHETYGQLMQEILELNQLLLSKQQDPETAYVITGSCVDGSVICCQRMKTIDVDVMIRPFKEIFSRRQTENLMKPAEGFPGYVIIDATDDWDTLYSYSLWVADKRLASIPKKVLSPKKSKDLISTGLDYLLPGFVDINKDKVSQKFLQIIVTLAAQDRENDLEILIDPSEVDYFPLILDYVPAVEAEGWPKSAEAFLHRERRWPDEKTISAIQEGGFHIIPKLPSDGDPDLHWRLSFSLAEAELATAMSEFQRKCFSLIKLIVYDVLKEVKEKRKQEGKDLSVTTYHSKTVLFWSCENETDMWMRGNLGECILSLLDDLLRCLSEENLPMYFIPENNILHYVDKVLLKEEVGLLKQFRQSLTLEPSPPLTIFPDGWKKLPPFIMKAFEEKASDVIKRSMGNFAKTVTKVCKNEYIGLTNGELAKKCVYDTVCELFPEVILFFPNHEALFPPGEGDISSCLIKPVLRGENIDLRGNLKIMAKAMECVFNTISFRYHDICVPFHTQGTRK